MKLRLLLLAGLCAGCVPGGAPQTPEARLANVLSADSLRAADTSAVLALGAQFGIPQPARFRPPFMQLGGCPVIELESPIMIDGNRRSWMELVVRRKGRDTGGHRCYRPDPAGETVKRYGRWMASSAELTERAVWRVNDGDWHVDVALGTGVAYDSAVVIVQAIRRRTLVNDMPGGLRRLFGDSLPVFDAGDIREISRDKDGYEVRTGERLGDVLYLTIVAGRVLVQSFGTWIS